LSAKKLNTRSNFQSKQSSGTKSSLGTTSEMPMKPASGAGHRHAPPPLKHRPAGAKIDIGEVAQQLRSVQGQGNVASNVGSGSGRQYKPKGGGGGGGCSNTVEGMKWSDKFGKPGRYSGDVNAEYVPHGVGSMQYDFGLTVEGKWVDGTLTRNDLDDGFEV